MAPSHALIPLVCDFCALLAVRVYVEISKVSKIKLVYSAGKLLPEDNDLGEWNTCEDCADLLERKDIESIKKRALTAYSCEHGPLDDLNAYHQALDSAYKGLKSGKLVRKS
jgi:hypothetical protein